MLTLSTRVTVVRIIVTPLVVIAMMYQQWGLASILFIGASLTDLLDGFLARLFNEKTRLGACLDPVADKLLLLSVFCALAFIQTPLFRIPQWFVLLIVCKECILIFGFLLLALVKGYIPDVHPTRLGKFTTFIQIIFITWLFVCYFLQWLPIRTFYVILVFVSSLVVVTFVHYMSIGIRMIRSSHAK
jgi:cardiolipin synthase (CMP-forming)